MVVELGAKEELTIKKIPLTPLHDMKELKGEYNQLVSRDYYEQMNTNDYMHITLTDEEDVPEALGRLRTIYPNIMKLDYDNKRTREHKEISNETVIEKSPMDYLKTFYELQNNQPINEEQETFALEIMERLWGK
jgi:exonuclease SbcD